jgi:hypothetical protein
MRLEHLPGRVDRDHIVPEPGRDRGELADAGAEIEDLPGPIPSPAYAMCSAAVPEAQLTARCPPGSSETAFSNAATVGPVVSQSPRRIAATASTSSSEMDWRP